MSRLALLTGASKLGSVELRALHDRLNPPPAPDYRPPANLDAVRAQLAEIMATTPGDTARVSAAKAKRQRKAAVRAARSEL